MKRLMALVILLSFLLSGCSLFVIDESTDAFRALSSQYVTYQINDISDPINFQEFVNDVTLETSISGVMIEVKVYSQIGLLIDTRYGSGVIFHQDNQFYHVLTDINLVSIDDRQNVSIQISDYLGRTYRGFVNQTDETLGLAGIRFQKQIGRNLTVLDIATQQPMIGEPVMLIGYQRQIINAMTMGLLTGYVYDDDNNPVSLTADIISDDFGNGGVIIDMRHRIIGIQVVAEDNHIVAITYQMIQLFYEGYI